MGLRPSWIVPDGLFAVLIQGKERYVNSASSNINSHVATSLAKDKYLTRLILARHDLQNIPFCSPQNQNDAAAFLQKYGKIIAKPLAGYGAQDIHIITDVAQLKHLEISRYILEKYVAGKELRYLVLNGAVISVHRSDYGVSVDEHRPLRRISAPSSAWDVSLVATSIQIAQLLDLRFAAVDFIIDDTGQAHILEINTSPGLKWFHAPTSGPVVDVARLFMEAFMEGQTIPVHSATVGRS